MPKPKTEIHQPIFFKIASFIIGINFEKTENPYQIEKEFKNKIEQYYSGFIFDRSVEKIDFWIEVKNLTSFDIFVKNKASKSFYINFYKQIKTNIIETYYHVSDQQFKIIIRTAVQYLISKWGGVIIHGSASLVRGQVYIFLAKSGGGKSTLMKMLSQEFAPMADDMMILLMEGKKIYFYQTPFIEKNSGFPKTSQKYLLGKMFFLKKAEYNNIEKITNKEIIFQPFLEQIFTEKPNINAQLKLIFKIISKFDEFYFFNFNLNKYEVLNVVNNL